jgi:Flp pilus assembly protein TadG
MFNRLLSRRRRDGVAATELAVCLPPLLLLVVASIEFANMIFLNHSLSIAAYEAARQAVAKQTANPEVENRCTEILTNRGVVGATITLAPSDITTAEPGQHVTVTISADCAANASILPLWFFQGHTMTSSVTMVREDT